MQAAIESGKPIPPNLLNAPDVPPEGLFYLHAFIALCSCRIMGFGSFGAIPWTAMNDYCTRYNVLDFDLFIQIIRNLDAHWLERQAIKSAKHSRG